MYLLENPVLQRELLIHLRTTKAFVLLLVYVALLGVVVYNAWPTQARIDLTQPSQGTHESKRLVDLLFLGQYVLASLMVPSFAAGTITGEKERQTYEMLLACPMRPSAIVLGKLLAALCHLFVMVFCSLPIVMLCLPLGGVSPYEVIATYVGMAAAIVFFGMICVAASSYFMRTIAALVVSYLMILPLALLGILFYNVTSGLYLLILIGGFVPFCCTLGCVVLWRLTSKRMMQPPDLGLETREVVDPVLEQRQSVGMIIRADRFPDKFFAPAKRTSLMRDGINPIYDKEMRSELFGQGTLMPRLVIQSSLLLAVVLMVALLDFQPQYAAWYVSFVVLFNVLVGPVFSAGSVTSERERQTLELLLTTTVLPLQILSGKLLSGLRVSSVLTSFLIWPILLATLLPPWSFIHDFGTIGWYLGIIVVTSLTTTTIAMLSSVICPKTSVSIMMTYLILIVLFAAPVVTWIFVQEFSPLEVTSATKVSGENGIDPGYVVARRPLWLKLSTATSPIAAAFSLPLKLEVATTSSSYTPLARYWWPETARGFMLFYLVFDTTLLGVMLWLFDRRWRVWL